MLLAQDEVGYGNLMKLNSALYLGKEGALPEVTVEDLAAHGGGLICLTGGPEGPGGVPVGARGPGGGGGASEAVCRDLPWTGFMWSCSGIPERTAGRRRRSG